jgi:hypothetical protein
LDNAHSSNPLRKQLKQGPRKPYQEQSPLQFDVHLG